MKGVLKKHKDVDGVMCATDTIAFGAMRALSEAKKRPGEDVPIAGVGDSWMDMYSIRPLTTAHFFYRQCGEDAAQMMLSIIEGNDAGTPTPVRQMCLEYEIIDRGSV